MTLLVCFNSTPITNSGFALTECNVIGDVSASFQLNPVDKTDGSVISIQRDGSIEYRSKGTTGPFETFRAHESFLVVNPQPTTYMFSYVTPTA